MSRDGWAALPRGATGLSAVCDCGISWSYSLTIFEQECPSVWSYTYEHVPQKSRDFDNFIISDHFHPMQVTRQSERGEVVWNLIQTDTHNPMSEFRVAILLTRFWSEGFDQSAKYKVSLSLWGSDMFIFHLHALFPQINIMLDSIRSPVTQVTGTF